MTSKKNAVLMSCKLNFMRDWSRNEDQIQNGPSALGSVATLEPGSTGTLSYEHKQPLIAGQNGAGHTVGDADGRWNAGEKSD